MKAYPSDLESVVQRTIPLSGDAVPVVDDLGVVLKGDQLEVSASSTGVLIYGESESKRCRLTWTDRRACTSAMPRPRLSTGMSGFLPTEAGSLCSGAKLLDFGLAPSAAQRGPSADWRSSDPVQNPCPR
jgi:hypothetical protein